MGRVCSVCGCDLFKVEVYRASGEEVCQDCFDREIDDTSELFMDRLTEESSDTTFKSGKGSKFDAGKLRYDLVEPEFLEELAVVMTKGAEVHGEYSYQKMERLESRTIAALMRHLQEIRKGNYVDKESGALHTAHIAANAMFLDWYCRNKIENKGE